jgi:hypothetical protein
MEGQTQQQKGRWTRQSRSGSIFSSMIDNQTDWNGTPIHKFHKNFVKFICNNKKSILIRSFCKNGGKSSQHRGLQEAHVQG